MNKAIFLDRDGTINIDTGYIGDVNLVSLFPGVAEGIKKLKDQLGFIIIVISNQSGITRGLITSEDVDRVNNRINELLELTKTNIDAFYYCPFHPDYDSQEKCKCRKPSPQLVFESSKKFNVDLTKSYFAGDKVSDIECGKNAGIKTVLIRNSLNEAEIIQLQNSQNSPNFVAGDFLTFVDFIEKDSIGEIF
jgi:D,D-heptose 1,7-bisphosphate phosphatase